ncbi:MAG: glycosyltransferase [Richelia sp. RM2_1_2]|nr:glycosyltransferase [Richelia sp. RM2_1_2]
MKICLVGGNSVQEFPVINYGGVESSVENLAWGFYNHNLDFFVITSNRKKKSDFPFEVRENGHEPLSFTNETQPEYYSGTRKVLDDLPQNETPDVIFCQSHEAAKSLLGYRNSLIIATFQDSCPKQPGWMDKNERLFFRFLSKAQFNNWVIEDWEREKSVQIYTGLTDENYYFSPSEKENYFLWVGAVGMNKGLDWFIYLASRNNNDKFISYGTASNEVLNE